MFLQIERVGRSNRVGRKHFGKSHLHFDSRENTDESYILGRARSRIKVRSECDPRAFIYERTRGWVLKLHVQIRTREEHARDVTLRERLNIICINLNEVIG